MSGIKFMGKDPGGNAKAIAVNANGYIKAEIESSEIQVPVDMQSHNIPDADPIPIKIMSIATGDTNIGNVGVVSLPGVIEILTGTHEIRDTSPLALVVDTSYMPGKKTIMVLNTLDKAVSISFRLGCNSVTNSVAVAGSTNIAAGTFNMITSISNGALLEPVNILQVIVTAAEAPTTGSVKVIVQGGSCG